MARRRDAPRTASRPRPLRTIIDRNGAEQARAPTQRRPRQCRRQPARKPRPTCTGRNPVVQGIAWPSPQVCRHDLPPNRSRRQRASSAAVERWFLLHSISAVNGRVGDSGVGSRFAPGCPRRRRMAHRERGRSRVFVFVYDIGLRQGRVPGSACARARRFGDRGRNGRRIRAPVRQRESGGAFMALKRAAAPP